MKRTYKAAAVVAAAMALSGLASCTAANTDKAAAAPEKAAAVETTSPQATQAPTTDDDNEATNERVCRATAADVEVGDRRLDNVEAGDSERVLRIAQDLQGRLDQYPGSHSALQAQVRRVADAYGAAAAALGGSGYAAQVVKVRAAQAGLAFLCAG